MLTRRNALCLAVGSITSLVTGMESITRGSLLATTYAQEPSTPAQGMTMETWMKDWMNVSKAPGGMLRISRFREPIYFLTAPISWSPNPDQKGYEAVTVPAGFVTDFASIPPIFWSVLRPDGKYAYAAVVHDYLYWTQTRTREEADHILKMAMEDFKVGAVTIAVIFKAVDLFGNIAWKGNAKKKAEGEKRVLTRFPQDPRTRWEEWKQRPGVFD